MGLRINMVRFYPRDPASQPQGCDSIVVGKNPRHVIVRAIGPSLSLQGKIDDPTIVATLTGNNTGYTAIVRGVNNTTGIAVVEVYALP